MPLPRDFHLEIRDKPGSPIRGDRNGSAVDPSFHPFKRSNSTRTKEACVDDGFSSLDHSVTTPSHKRWKKYNWLSTVSSQLSPGTFPFRFTSWSNKDAGDVDSGVIQRNSKTAGEDGVDPKPHFTEQTPNELGKSPSMLLKERENPQSYEDSTAMLTGTIVEFNHDYNVDSAVYDFERSHGVDGPTENHHDDGEEECCCLIGCCGVNAASGWGNVDPARSRCSSDGAPKYSGVDTPLRLNNETLSDCVDAVHSDLDAVLEEASRDWEPHEAEVILSDIYNDLGDTCICLLEDGCICSLDECLRPDQDACKQRRAETEAEMQSVELSTYKASKSCCGSDRQVKPVKTPGSDKENIEVDSGTDPHCLQSSGHSVDTGNEKKLEQIEHGQPSGRVVRNTRPSPRREETEVDYAVLKQCRVVAIGSDNLENDEYQLDTKYKARGLGDQYEEQETASFGMRCHENIILQSEHQNTNFLSVDSESASNSPLAHAKDAANFVISSTGIETTKYSAADKDITRQEPTDWAGYAQSALSHDDSRGENSSFTDTQAKEAMISGSKACSTQPALSLQNESVGDTNFVFGNGKTRTSESLNSSRSAQSHGGHRAISQSACSPGSAWTSAVSGPGMVDEYSDVEHPQLSGATSLQTVEEGYESATSDCRLSSQERNHSDAYAGVEENLNPISTSAVTQNIFGDVMKHSSSAQNPHVPISRGRGSRIPKRMSCNAGENTRSQQAEQPQKAGSNNHTPDSEFTTLGSQEPASGEMKEDGAKTEYEHCTEATSEKKRARLKVITTDKCPKPYVPQVIMFYKHKDGKSTTTIPPAVPVPQRKAAKTPMPQVPNWNCSTHVEKSKQYIRPLPLQSKRNRSLSSLVSASSQNSRQSLTSSRAGDSLDRLTAVDSASGTAEFSADNHSSASSLRHGLKKSVSVSQREGGQLRQPFRPAGGVADSSKRRKLIPASNTARSHPDLRVPGCRVEVPVVYPCSQSKAR